MIKNSAQTEPGKIRHLVIGLFAVALLIFIKVQVEDLSFGRWFNARGYEVLHSFLANYNPDADPPVIVLDISDLKRDPDGTVPNRSLRELVSALLESRAKAIAIDINFAPRTDPQDRIGARAEDDPEFFEFLHAQKAKGAHVFVGVHKFGVDPAEWLGMEDDKDLAADMSLTDEGVEDMTEVHAWLQCRENAKLYSISTALAETSDARPRPPRWLDGVLLNYDDPENLKGEEQTETGGKRVICRRAYTLVNYAKLELVQKLTLQTLDRDSILRAKDVEGVNRFQNKLVLIGNGQRGVAGEKFYTPPGRNRPVAGIYIHALAANTLVADPVYKFKHWFAILLDASLGLFVVVGLFIVRLRHRKDDSFSTPTWENRFIWTSIVVTLSVGFVLVKLYNVLWLDFLLVVLALLLHSRVQHGLAHVPQRLFGSKPETTKE